MSQYYETVLKNAPISDSAKCSMASSALEFSEKVVKATDPLLIEIFQRIERGETTHKEEVDKLLLQFNRDGKVV